MMAQLIDRKHLKQEMKELLRSAQVSPRGMTCLYLALVLVLNLADSFMGLMNPGLLGTFISILTGLMSMVLASGFVMYCMAIRRGERAEYLTLFDGFSFVGKVILLNIVIYLFTFFWSLLFVIPGIIAAYRYRFALYNLYENPGIGVMEALNMSKQQTLGYKGQLFMLDLSYIGWLLLASLTSVVQTGYIYACIFQDPGYRYRNVSTKPLERSFVIFSRSSSVKPGFRRLGPGFLMSISSWATFRSPQYTTGFWASNSSR